MYLLILANARVQAQSFQKKEQISFKGWKNQDLLIYLTQK